jgi:hypothetical protein
VANVSLRIRLLLPAILAVVVLPLAAAAAQEKAWTPQDAMHEASSEAAQCVAYYAYSQKCADNAGRTALSGQLQRAIDSAMRAEFTTGKAAGMSNSALLASLKLSLDAAKEAIGDSCVNISVPIAKYAAFCRGLLEHPDVRIQTLMQGQPTPLAVMGSADPVRLLRAVLKETQHERNLLARCGADRHRCRSHPYFAGYG